MSPLIYLSLSRLKNTIRDLFRKPARLIYVVFLVALFVLAIGGNQSWSSFTWSGTGFPKGGRFFPCPM